MSQQQYIKTIERELQKLNQRIDMKIISGESYTRESRRHKQLLRQIREQRNKKGMFGRFFGTPAHA